MNHKNFFVNYYQEISKLLKNLSKDYKNIYMKIDIESAEYDVLEKMIKDKTHKLVERMWVECHPQYMTTSDSVNAEKRMKKIEDFLIQENVNIHSCFGPPWVCRNGLGCASCMWSWIVP